MMVIRLEKEEKVLIRLEEVGMMWNKLKEVERMLI